MASSNEEGTAAAAAEQLGSLSLGVSAERKENDTKNNEDAEEHGTPTKLCSACGEKSDTLMKCRACKCAWYCDKKCQNKHWKEHKKECKRIKQILDERGGRLDLGEELDIGPLPDLPPREECPICMHTLPIQARLQSYAVCCGKKICGGCGFQHQMRARDLGSTCAFCRTDLPDSDEEILAQLSKRVELKDPDALQNMAMFYRDGDFGLPVDEAKCIDLLRESAGLGSPSALYQLGNFFHNGQMGLQPNEEEAIKYAEKAAKGGHILSRHNVGCVEHENGNVVAAMRHWRLSASGGYRISMRALIDCFEEGILHHGDLGETLQAFYRVRAEMTSADRDLYIAYLKNSGEYEEGMDS